MVVMQKTRSLVAFAMPGPSRGLCHDLLDMSLVSGVHNLSRRA